MQLDKNWHVINKSDLKHKLLGINQKPIEFPPSTGRHTPVIKLEQSEAK